MHNLSDLVGLSIIMVERLNQISYSGLFAYTVPSQK